MVVTMNSKEDLLEKYDGANQDTKREIIKHLYENPKVEHDAESVFEAIRDNCRAGKSDSVANQLSSLAQSDEQIVQEKRSFYQWKGEGQKRPNRRFREARVSIGDWLGTLDLSYGTILIGFFTWLLGILCAVGSLIALFSGNSFAGIRFIWWFRASGLLTILGSSVFMIWIPLYILDTRMR
jgi:hypothetical protein